MIPDRGDFQREYRRATSDVLRFMTPAMQDEMALHNAGWRCGATDFPEYLSASGRRFYEAFRHTGITRDDSLCDVGGFWGVWPLTLVRLGWSRIAMTEALQYYSTTFEPLFSFLAGEGVDVIDFDPFGDSGGCPGSYDVVTLMAVLEHYPHSPRWGMSRILGLLADDGRLLVEVPNIAYGPKRLGMMAGRSPLPPLDDVWASKVPFTGHHREYTRGELRSLARLSGLSVESEYELDYSEPSLSLKRAVLHPLLTLSSLLPCSSEVLGMVCTRNEARRRDDG